MANRPTIPIAADQGSDDPDSNSSNHDDAGQNVLYLDGHVEYWEDPTWDDGQGTGKVLYDNGLDSSSNPEWLHDDIWQIIDGYHKPPVGSGNR